MAIGDNMTQPLIDHLSKRKVWLMTSVMALGSMLNKITENNRCLFRREVTGAGHGGPEYRSLAVQDATYQFLIAVLGTPTPK
jgi:hypothetical protein